MMLYVFHVDNGNMITFDMRLVSERVGQLKEAVEKYTGIAVDKQVLLISGGECLDDEKSIGSYAAGTDTNPIFLFSKAVIEAQCPPTASTESDLENDTTERIKEAMDLPPSFNTVHRRTQLAQQLHERAKEQLCMCEKLVHDQHLQQQGWSAAVASLEDIAAEFKKRTSMFSAIYAEYLNQRSTYIMFLKHFHDDLDILRKIPIVPVLIQPECNDGLAELEGSKEEEEDMDTKISQTEMSRSEEKTKTLFDWISITEEKNNMDQLYEMCSRGLEQFSENVCNSMNAETLEVITNSDNNQMKEVKGLGERLSGLETLMREAKRLVQEQAENAKSFFNNQSRVSNLKDASILPDLCSSHRKQLLQMAQNHQQLCDIRRRCTKAKEELCANLYHRLKWVNFIENKIYSLDHRLVIFHETLKRLRRHLDCLQQIHLTPAMYLCAVAEVVRRRKFSHSFLLWASDLACQLLTIHNNEVSRRKDFQAQFEGHFLNSLFTGMNDLPPSFATQAPAPFDLALPRITEEDVERLRQELPDLAAHLVIPDTSSFTNFFMLKSLVKAELDKVEDSQDIKDVEQKLVQVIQGVGLASNIDSNLLRGTGSEPSLTTAHGLPHLRDIDRGCESETDTEEFEKVGQSPLDPSPRPGTQDAATSTEVGDRCPLPPKKPPRSFQRPPYVLSHSSIDDTAYSSMMQRTLSVSSTQSNTESFTNIKNPSLDSIDELSSLRNFTSTSDSCFNSHHQQMQNIAGNFLIRSKSISPNTPQSPKDMQESLSSPHAGHQPQDFLNDEFYIDESLPSSLSIETGHSQGEFVKQLDTANNVVAILQDNLQISRSEHERLKSTLESLSQLSSSAVAELRNELKDMKNSFLNDIDLLESGYRSLTTPFQNFVLATESLTANHEAEISSMKNIFAEKEDEFGNLKIAHIVLEQKYQKTCEELTEIKVVLTRLKEEHSSQLEILQKQLLEKEAEKDKTIKETIDRLNREHKAELENIRSRFKLMTMERSPSESSLEKIGEFSSLPNHETILLQMNETFEMNKEKAVKAAMEKESERWQQVLDERISQMDSKFAEEKQLMLEDVAKKINEEKEKQIDVLREREKNLNLEIIKYKSTIQQLTEAEMVTSSSDLREKAELREKFEQLKRENDLLKEEMEMLKKSPHDMAASVAVIESSAAVPHSDGAVTSTSAADETMTLSTIENMSESTASTVGKTGKRYTDKCPKGQRVVVYWDATHHNFRVDLDGKLYFLHCDYLPVMNLEVIEGVPNKQKAYGEVIDKEYCMSKKDDNRYNVPKGKKFFRVKVKPIEGEPSELVQDKGRPPSIPEASFEPEQIIAATIEHPEEILPESVEKNSFHDSGVVEGQVEEAAVAIENLVPGPADENDDR